MIVEELEVADIELQSDSKREVEVSSVLFTFDELRKKLTLKEVDYLELHKFQMEIGKLGEAYVYEMELKKLEGTIYEELVDNKKALDPQNGYDILSYDSEGNKLHIEVKTTVKNDTEFFITSTELNTAKQMKAIGEKYLIYRVSNILAKNKKDIRCEVISDIFDNDDFLLEESLWKVKNVKNSIKNYRRGD
ncbi:DUF3883 domain-containing protein [Paenibacillus naphthalenovorans]|uniref:DUF3883 domain-containing protein n=1 Tax=Paenibacillus naphthalenovorans TaxID=162209 RepID=UPI000880BD47|nr:DUF3883 domain-containing protein [Paenibacillus naphthalenovorans]SDJ44473.1 protein of unknown function [Paenibacillus naphthalenovorans]